MLGMEELYFKKVMEKDIQELLDHLDKHGKKNFTHDISTEEQRLDLGGFVKDTLMAYGFLKFNNQSFRKDLCCLGLVVHQKYRSKGIGSSFVKKLIEEAKNERAFQVSSLHTHWHSYTLDLGKDQ